MQIFFVSPQCLIEDLNYMSYQRLSQKSNNTVNQVLKGALVTFGENIQSVLQDDINDNSEFKINQLRLRKDMQDLRVFF